MSPIFPLRHQITVGSPVRVQRLICLLSGLLGSVGLWITDASLCAKLGWSQSSIELPDSDRQLERTPPPPTQPYPRTFSPSGGPPPTGYSPQPFNEDPSGEFNTYRLDLGDTISVAVQDFPEFSFSGSIDPEGNIFVPFLGRLSIVGLTLSEVETKISYELGRRYLNEEPKIIASLIGPRQVQLTVLGEVIRPGFYALPPGTNLINVLLSAGGGTSNADLRSIIIRRSLVDRTLLEEKVDLYTPLIQGRSLPNVRLQGGDTIIVSRLEVGTDQDYDRFLIARTTLTQTSITIRVLVPTNPAGTALRNLRLPNGSTFLDVIATLPAADGLRIRRDEVALLRFDPERGRVVTQTLNPDAAIEDGDLSQNVPLEDQDVIIVSRTLYGKILAGFNVITQPIRDIRGFTNFIDDFSDFGNDNNNNDRNRGFF